MLNDTSALCTWMWLFLDLTTLSKAKTAKAEKANFAHHKKYQKAGYMFILVVHVDMSWVEQ